MAVVAGSVWVVACAAAVVIAKRRERGFLIAGLVIATIAMAIAVDRSIGLSDRLHDSQTAIYVEVRNHSGSSLDLSVGGGDPPSTSIRGGGRTFVRADRLPGRFCLPGPATASDGATTFELVDCYSEGGVVVTWDGSEAYTDLVGSPLVLDSRSSRVASGFAVGAVALLGAVALDRRRIRRRSPITLPA